MVFVPSLDQDAENGFYTLVDGLLDDVLKCGSLIPRVAKHKELTDYYTDMEEVK